MFSTQLDNCIPICPYFYILSLSAAELEEPKVGISCKRIPVSFYQPSTPFMSSLYIVTRPKKSVLLLNTSLRMCTLAGLCN